MNVTMFTAIAEVRGFLGEWRQLYTSSGRGLFQSPDWFLIWWECLGREDGWTPHVAAGHVDGKLVAVAPLAVRQARGLRKLEWAGIDVFDYPDILAHDDDSAAVLWCQIRKSSLYDVARLRDVRSDARCRVSLDQVAHKAHADEMAHAITFGEGSGIDWFTRQSARAKSNHRANMRSLELLGPVSLKVVTLPADVLPMTKALVTQKKAWSQSRAIDTVFLRHGANEFFERLASCAMQEGTLHLSALMCGDRTVATHLGFVSDDGFYYYMPGYDQELAKASPGRVHLTLLVMWAIDHGCHRFDFLRGEEPYKTTLASETRALSSYVFSRGILGKIAERYYLRRVAGQRA